MNFTNKENQLKHYGFFKNHKNINQTFHHHTYLIDLLIDELDIKNINFLEIGTYYGFLPLYLSERYNIKKWISIDPLVLENQENILIDNTKHLQNFEIYKKYSNDETIDFDINFDIIFIDGSHYFDDVIFDFKKYSKYIKGNGIIIFDDYNDDYNSPEVKKAIDYMESNNFFSEFNIIKNFEVNNIIFSNGMKKNISNLYFLIKK